ncbi:MAG: conjugative transfer signal peptidase TraF [Gammaproteobacteria bacterium]|nr:conjugative transfer signal peptidase TraF [Gammaproteobacteria bacterium]
MGWLKISTTVLFVFLSIYCYNSFVINITPSEPLGIYKIHQISEVNQIHRDDIVAVCLSSRYQDLGLRQGYLFSGMRCGKTAPLIKTVVALPGDTVILKSNEVVVNGKVLIYATKYIDSHGRRLDVFPRGVYKNIKTYWLIGTSDPNSWDSRYWGGVNRKNIVFTVVPLLTQKVS